MSLKIESRAVGEITVFNCHGRIVEGDESTVLESSVRRLLPLRPLLLLNLGAVSFIDSAGLGLLLRLHTLVRGAAGDLRLCAVNRHIEDVLRVTKLNTVLVPYQSETEAITAFYAGDDSRDSHSSLDIDILCVHPSLDVLAYVRELLKRAGYGVATVTNVSDAEVLLRATSPTVVVIAPELQQALNELSGDNRLGGIQMVPLPAEVSTEDPGDASRQLLDHVSRAVASAE